MTRFYSIVVFLVVLVGCGHKAPDGLPASQEWNSQPAGALVAMPGAPAATSPHGSSGTDVSKLGLPPPDPSRAIDPSHHLRGEITVKPELAAHVKDGGAVFLIAKRDGGNGTPSGPPLAVQKLAWHSSLQFELTERNAMIAGTELTGDVIVVARFDQDGDALTKQPGDVMGQARIKVPSDAVAIVLDTVLP